MNVISENNMESAVPLHRTEGFAPWPRRRDQ